MEKCKVLIEDYVPDLLSTIPENHLEFRFYKARCIFLQALYFCRKSQLKYFSGSDNGFDPDNYGGSKIVFQYGGAREEMITEL